MRVLRNIKGVTLRDRIRSDDLPVRAECNVIDVARWVRTRETTLTERDRRDGQAGQNTKSGAPTDPQEDRLKDDERAVRQRQKRTDTDKQQVRVLKEKMKKKMYNIRRQRQLRFCGKHSCFVSGRS
jgi:hypothetical protein